jgi:hypothetical protein
MKKRFLLLITLASFAVCGPTGSAFTQTKEPIRNLKCWQGGNHLEFSFDGKGGATLTKIEGPAIVMFEDLKETEWSARTVVENGVASIHVANKRGALLSIYAARKTLGRLTWNNPPESKSDVICDMGP